MNHRVVNNLLEFSDDILLLICSKLNHSDLLSLLGTCQRLHKISLDHSLWKKVDLRACPLSASQVSRQVLVCLHQKTTTLHFKGHKRTKFSKWKTGLITPAILKTLGTKCPNLTEISFSEAVVNARQVKLVNFEEVKAISHLSFVDCEFINLPSPTIDGSYFKHMPMYLPNLKSLEVSHANWITDYDLMVLSKLNLLQTLILKCSLRIGIHTSYLAISFRFGFKGLHELDMRGTSLSNIEIQSISQGGLLRCLKVGPIGRIKRLKNDISEGYGLVIPDPHRRDELIQQVVVISMSPNGPEWKQASEDDLADMMGHKWIKNGLNKIRDNAAVNDDEHFFFGEEGKIVRKEAPSEDISSDDEEDDSECVVSGVKRNLEDNEMEEEASATKRRRVDKEEEKDELVIEENFVPDELLSDLMTRGLRSHGQNLRWLELVGCAVTNKGILELLDYLPKLNHLDVSKSHVTIDGAQRARCAHPGCTIICVPQGR